MENIGQRIKTLRIELNLTQEELAKRLGYGSRSTINKIEMGINDIAQSKIAAFAKALLTTPAYLMGWTEDPLSANNDSRQKPNQIIAITNDGTKIEYSFTDEDMQTVLAILERMKK